MYRPSALVIAFAIGTAFLAGAPACSKGMDAPAANGAPAAATPPAASTTTVPTAHGVTIAGVVKFEGPAPVMPPQDRKLNDFCKALPHTQSWVLVDAAAGVKDVLVRIVAGAPTTATPPTTPLVIDQRECDYTPHMAGIVKGQPVVFSNSDDTIHMINVKNPASASAERYLINDAQPAGAAARSYALDVPAGTVVPIRCEAHPWMESWVAVNDNPYFTVTGADGTFQITNVPPGTYQLEAWHPYLGKRTVDVTVAAGSGGPRVTFPPFTPGDYTPPSVTP